MTQQPDFDPTQLPFDLETALEHQIAADPAWRFGIHWGQPRPGHPEGQVVFHIRDVLQNIDTFYGRHQDRSRLRLIALVHDTFKYKKAETPVGEKIRPHGFWAREFTEHYLLDQGVLAVIEQHDDAYKAYRLLDRDPNDETAVSNAQMLIARLGTHLDLYLHFYYCDNRTGDKSVQSYEWFLAVVRMTKT